MEVWVRQFTGRVSGEEFELGGWIWNIPRAIGYCLPWVILLVFVPSAFRRSGDGQVARALAWGIAVPFLVVNLLPGGLPRYTMPLLVPVIWLIAMAVTAPRLGTTEIRFGDRVEPVRAVMLRLTQLFDITGHPAITLPLAREGRLPCGFQLVGRRARTPALLAAAATVERALERASA